MVVFIFFFFFFFFFKQKTAYEMRISDWSSDVCSSDLRRYWLARHNRGADADLARNSRNGPPSPQPDLRGARLCSREGLAIVGSPVGPREPESRARPAAASEGARESQSHALCRTAHLHDHVAAKTLTRAAWRRKTRKA